MKSLLVTGGAGFIGSCFVRQIIAGRAARVVVLDNLTYAGNEAEGCILAVTSEKGLGEAYNLAGDGEITQREYFNKVAECIGVDPVTKKVPYPVARSAAFVMELFGHLFRTKSPPLVTRYTVWLMGRKCYFSSDKARRELGWQATVGYDEGIELAVKWSLEHVGC